MLQGGFLILNNAVQKRSCVGRLLPAIACELFLRVNGSHGVVPPQAKPMFDVPKPEAV